MTNKTYWDSFKAESGNVLNKVKMLIHEGNVRRVVVKHEGRTVAEFPLTAGVVGALLAPVLAAIGALVALLQDCMIEVERERQEGSRDVKGPVEAWRQRESADRAAANAPGIAHADNQLVVEPVQHS